MVRGGRKCNNWGGTRAATRKVASAPHFFFSGYLVSSAIMLRRGIRWGVTSATGARKYKVHYCLENTFATCGKTHLYGPRVKVGRCATHEGPKAMLRVAFSDKQWEEEELYTLYGDDDDDDSVDCTVVWAGQVLKGRGQGVYEPRGRYVGCLCFK